MDRAYYRGDLDKDSGSPTGYKVRPLPRDAGRLGGGSRGREGDPKHGKPKDPIVWGTGEYAGTIKGRHDQMRGIDHPIAGRKADELENLNRIRRGAMPQWQRDMEDAEFLKQQDITRRIQKSNQRSGGGLRLR